MSTIDEDADGKTNNGNESVQKPSRMFYLFIFKIANSNQFINHPRQHN